MSERFSYFTCLSISTGNGKDDTCQIMSYKIFIFGITWSVRIYCYYTTGYKLKIFNCDSIFFWNSFLFPPMFQLIFVGVFCLLAHYMRSNVTEASQSIKEFKEFRVINIAYKQNIPIRPPWIKAIQTKILFKIIFWYIIFIERSTYHENFKS